MGTTLNDLTVIEHGDLIAEAARGQAMTDIDGCFVADDLVELRIDLIFSDGIKCGKDRW